MAMFMVKPWYKKNNVDPAIYGAEWAGSGSPAWTRTDAAANFADPSPQYKMSNSTWSVGSSPFDNIMPWAGMRIVEDSSAGTLVEIPKFYYKWTRSGTAMKLQITSSPVTARANGFYTSPAHADRGDGVGERNYVYVARYHCATSSPSYKSKTGYNPVGSKNVSDFRTYIHNLGANIWQYDFAMYWTIMMLYLVEFAHWNSQEKIGYGCGEGTSVVNNGATDSMTYHTGTNVTSRTTYGHVQYRHIEGLWSNVETFVDGIFFQNADVYTSKNPSDYRYGYTRGEKVGTRATTSGVTTSWITPNQTGYEYALYPNSANSSAATIFYVCDKSKFNNSGTILIVGGNCSGQSLDQGAFFMDGYQSGGTYKSSLVGGRLMVLPPSRLT